MSTKKFSGKQARFYPDINPKKKIPGTFRLNKLSIRSKISILNN